MSRIRERDGLDVFRRFFAVIGEQCLLAGLVWGKDLYFDATTVEAKASLDSVAPRFAVEAHLGALFTSTEAPEDVDEGGDSAGPAMLPVGLTIDAHAALAAAAANRHDWIGEAGQPDRSVLRGDYRRVADFRASFTDSGASLMRYRGGVWIWATTSTSSTVARRGSSSPRWSRRPRGWRTSPCAICCGASASAGSCGRST